MNTAITDASQHTQFILPPICSYSGWSYTVSSGCEGHRMDRWLLPPHLFMKHPGKNNHHLVRRQTFQVPQWSWNSKCWRLIQIRVNNYSPKDTVSITGGKHSQKRSIHKVFSIYDLAVYTTFPCNTRMSLFLHNPQRGQVALCPTYYEHTQTH